MTPTTVHADQLSGHSREQLIWKARQVFRQRGYYATSMAELGKACDMLKGSLYYHFASKEDLMQQVLLTVHRVFREQVFQLAYQPSGPPRQRLQAMLKATERLYFAQKGGCLMAQVGLEAGERIPAFRAVVHQFFQEWVEAFTHLLLTQYPAELADDKARAAVQELQGALQLACIYDEQAYFTRTCERILAGLA